MSYVRADVNLNGIEELELYVEFEKKLKALQQTKYSQGQQSMGIGIGVNTAGSILTNPNQPVFL